MARVMRVIRRKVMLGRKAGKKAKRIVVGSDEEDDDEMSGRCDFALPQGHCSLNLEHSLCNN